MKIVAGQALGCQSLAQGRAEGCRAAEPDAAVEPVGHGGYQLLGMQQSIAATEYGVLANSRRFGQCLDAAQDFGVADASAVEQVYWPDAAPEAASSCMRATKGVMPIPPATQIWRGLSSSKTKRP